MRFWNCFSHTFRARQIFFRHCSPYYVTNWVVMLFFLFCLIRHFFTMDFFRWFFFVSVIAVFFCCAHILVDDGSFFNKTPFVPVTWLLWWFWLKYKVANPCTYPPSYLILNSHTFDRWNVYSYYFYLYRRLLLMTQLPLVIVCKPK